MQSVARTRDTARTLGAATRADAVLFVPLARAVERRLGKFIRQDIMGILSETLARALANIPKVVQEAAKKTNKDHKKEEVNSSREGILALI